MPIRARVWVAVLDGTRAIWTRGPGFEGIDPQTRAKLAIKPMGANLPPDLSIDAEPRLSGDWVAFVHFRRADRKRFLYAFNTRTRKLLGPLSDDYDIQGYDLAGDYLVWGEVSAKGRGIRLYNLRTQELEVISPSGSAPATDGHTVVWAVDSSEPYAYDIAARTLTRVADGRIRGGEPDVEGDWMVYTTTVPNGLRVRAHNLKSGVETDLTAALPDRDKLWYARPRISGGHVVLVETDFESKAKAVWVVPGPTAGEPRDASP